MVSNHQKEKNGLFVTHWSEVAKLLDRPVRSCQTKHQLILDTNLSFKVGYFSIQEDTTIRDEVAIFDNDETNSDLWNKLSLVLHRTERCIKQRWSVIKNDERLIRNVFWTDEMVCICMSFIFCYHDIKLCFDAYYSFFTCQYMFCTIMNL